MARIRNNCTRKKRTVLVEQRSSLFFFIDEECEEESEVGREENGSEERPGVAIRGSRERARTSKMTGTRLEQDVGIIRGSDY